MIIQKKLSKFNTNKAATIIPISAFVVAASAVTGTILYLSKPETTKCYTDTASIVQTLPSGKISKPDYTLETNYKGHLSQFPELYEIPFRKTDSYICNKDLSREHYNVLEEYENDATAFIEALLNVDYRTVTKTVF